MHSEYHNRLRAWIADALQNNSTQSFSDLVCALPGVHPNDVARELHQLGFQGLSLGAPKTNVTRSKRQSEALPVPHPLDYDWRFTPDTRSQLLRNIADLTGPSCEEVVFLGAPTLFRAAQQSLANRCFLIDACEESVSILSGGAFGRVFLADILTDSLPTLSACVALADPPWYEEFAHAFLWASCNLVRLGGTVLLSSPPIGTRPGIDLEWSRILGFATKLGLELRSRSQCLQYESPPFERNSIRAAQHPHVDSQWRPGVLATFQKVQVCAVARPEVPSDRGHWLERSALAVRFRMRTRAYSRPRNPVLGSLTKGDILDSVSRRDPRRGAADVWTSGNRIFECADTEALAWIVEAVEKGHQPDTYVQAASKTKLTGDERTRITKAADQVRAIISFEMEEYGLSWEG